MQIAMERLFRRGRYIINFRVQAERMQIMSFSRHCSDNLIYLTSDMFTATGLVKHGFSTRHGNLDDRVTRDFNLGFKNGNPAHVRQMRHSFLAALGISLDNLVAGQQTHGTNVEVVTTSPRGAFRWEDGLPDTDALVTATPDLALSVYTADCVPLLFLDPVRKAVAAAHAGWRGSVNGIAVSTLLRLQQEFGSRPEDVLVAIGPSIGPCCYEIDEQVLTPLQGRIPFWQELIQFSRPGHFFLNLWQLNQLLLLGAGVRKEHISIAGLCTYCLVQDFFSYRAEQGRAGSLMAVISL